METMSSFYKREYIRVKYEFNDNIYTIQIVYIFVYYMTLLAI